MYKEPKEAAKVTAAGEIFGVGEFLLVCNLYDNLTCS